MKNRRIAVIVIILLLTSIVFTGLNSPALSDVRNVDILKIFASGVLTGVLITIIREIYLEKKKS